MDRSKEKPKRGGKGKTKIGTTSKVLENVNRQSWKWCKFRSYIHLSYEVFFSLIARYNYISSVLCLLWLKKVMNTKTRTLLCSGQQDNSMERNLPVYQYERCSQMYQSKEMLWYRFLSLLFHERYKLSSTNLRCIISYQALGKCVVNDRCFSPVAQLIPGD